MLLISKQFPRKFLATQLNKGETSKSLLCICLSWTLFQTLCREVPVTKWVYSILDSEILNTLYVFLQCWGSNPRPWACEANTLLQSRPFICLFALSKAKKEFFLLIFFLNNCTYLWGTMSHFDTCTHCIISNHLSPHTLECIFTLTECNI
jgi:hypothetical protein